VRLRYRWARVNALYQERDALAARSELDANPPLAATTRDEALLILAVLRAIAHQIQDDTSVQSIEGQSLTQRDVLRRVSAIAKRFPDDEEILARVLTISLSMPSEDNIDPEALLQARELQDLFFARFPESKLIQRITIPDSPEELVAMVGGQLSASAGSLEQLRKAAFVGQVPLNGYAAAAQRSYAQGLAQNAAGAYVIEGVNPEIRNVELDAARSSLNNDIVVDTSALFHAARVLGDIQNLHNHFTRLILPSPLRDDILSARASLARRSAGSFGWAPVEQAPRVSMYDEATTDRWADEAQRLADTIPLCDVLPDPPYDGDLRNRAWSSAIRLAKERQLSLVADDVALRHVARTEGVSAFGTLHLLKVLVENDTLPGSAMDAALERLQEITTAEGFDLAVVQAAIEDRFTAVLVPGVDVGSHEGEVGAVGGRRRERVDERVGRRVDGVAHQSSDERRPSRPPLPVDRWCRLIGVVVEPEFVALCSYFVGPRGDAGYAGRPLHPASHVLGLVGAEQLVGQEPGHPLAGGQPWFDEPPGTGSRLDRRSRDGFDGEAAGEIRIGDEPAERCGVIGDGDQPKSGSRVGGVDRPDGLARSYAGLGPLAVPVSL
jgi:predicted nucleic acid-binding protein